MRTLRLRHLVLVLLGAVGSPACESDKSSSNPPGVESQAVPDTVLDLQIDLDPADWARVRNEGRSLNAVFSGCDDPTFEYTVVRASVTSEGQTIRNVGLRKKGYLGSISVVRPSLRLDFAEYEQGQRFRGARHLTLNNSRQDPSFTHTCMAYAAFARAGVPAPRCSFARVRVGGEELGLYVNLEPITKPFLARQFGDDSGTLYEGSGGADFRADMLASYEQKTNDDTPDRKPLEAVAALLEQPLDEARLATLETLVDLPRFLRFWAVESLISHWDGYAGNLNNHFVYVDPRTKRLVFIPWGADGAFDRDHAFLPEAGRPISALASARLPRRLYEHAPTRARYETTLREVLATTWDEPRLVTEVDRIGRLAAGTISDADLEKQREFIRTRRAELERELAAGAPPWTLPERSASHCVPNASTTAQGSFSTAWGAIDGVRPDPAQTLELLPGGAPFPAAARLTTAGVATDASGRGAAIRLANVAPDGSLLVVQLALGRQTIAPGVIPFHGFETFGAVLTGKTQDSLTLVGLIGEGSVTLEQAGTTDGAPVTGRFEGKLVSTQLGAP